MSELGGNPEFRLNGFPDETPCSIVGLEHEIDMFNKELYRLSSERSMVASMNAL